MDACCQVDVLYCVLAFVVGVLVAAAWNRPRKVMGALTRFGGEELKMQFVVPKSFTSLGLVASECCKACIALYESVHTSTACQRWESTGWRKIVLKCEDESELASLQREAQSLGVPSLMRAHQSGLKVLCLGPAEDQLLSRVTGALKLL